MSYPYSNFMFALIFWGTCLLYLHPHNSNTLCAQPSKQLKKHIDRLVHEELNTLNMPFGIAIGIMDEGYEYRYFYGELNPNRQDRPDSSTLFALNALGKVFATTVFAAMAQEGIVSPKDFIGQYLPDSVAQNPHLHTITLQDLACHTAGFPKNPSNAAETALDDNNLLGNYRLNDLYAYLQHYTPATAKPVGTFSYSHTGICLLTVILAKAAQTPYPELLKKYVLAPLSMTNTSALPDTLKSKPQRAIGQEFNGRLSPAISLQLFADTEGLYSNLEDMMTFLRANMTAPDSSIIGQTHIGQHKTSTKRVMVGTGWFVVSESKNGPQIITHSGRAGGYSCYMGFEKTRRTGIVLLSNSARRCDEIGISIMELLLR